MFVEAGERSALRAERVTSLARQLVKQMEEEFGQRSYHGYVVVVGTTIADVIARTMYLFKESRGLRIVRPVLELEPEFGGLVIRFRPTSQE